MRILISLIALTALVISAITFSGCSSSENKSPGDNPGANSGEKSAASTAAAIAVPDLGGNPVPLAQYIGNGPVVLNFWGTWCPPCRREIPDLIRIYDEYKSQGLEIIGIAVNDSPGRVKAFAAEYGVNWIMLLANYEVVQAFQIGRGIPVTVFLDRNGTEIERYIGMRSYQDFKIALEKII